MQRHPNCKPIRLSWQLCSILTLLLFLAMISGCQRSNPLSLGPSETIRATLKPAGSGPFHIGASLPLILTVEAKNGVTFEQPDFNGPSLGGLEFKQTNPPRTEKFPGGFRQTTCYLFTGWQVGQYTIPETTLHYTSPAKPAGTLTLAPVKINLVSVLPKGKPDTDLLNLAIKGTKYPLGLTPRYSLIKWFLLAAFLMVLIVLSLRFIRRFLFKTQEATEAKIKEPADIIALRRLTGLKEMPLTEQSEYKAFYSGLSECIREYMENRYQIPALEMTTEEFLARLLTGDTLGPEYQSLIQNILEQSDLVKFARLLPPSEEAGQALFQVEQFVAATKELPARDGSAKTEPNEIQEL